MNLVGHGRAVAFTVVLGAGALGTLGLQPALAAHTAAGLYSYPGSPFTGGCAEGGSGTLSTSTAQVARTGSTISVTIKLTDGQANTTYDAELLQSGACGSTIHQFTTRTDGTGGVQFSELAAAAPGQNPLIVNVALPTAICSCGGPSGSGELPAYRSAALKV